MKKIVVFILLSVWMVSLNAYESKMCDSYAHLKIRPESGWQTDAEGNLPTITLVTPEGTYMGTPASQTSAITFNQTVVSPIVEYDCTDNFGHRYRISSQSGAGTLYVIFIYYVY